MLIMFKKKPNKNKNKSVFWKNVKKFPGFFPFFRFPFAEKRTASRWASCGAREAISLSSRRCMQCATKSSKVIRSTKKHRAFFHTVFFFLHPKRKGKMKCKKNVIWHICNFYVILIFAYVHLCNHTFGGGLGAAVRLPCRPTPRNKSCK